MSMPYAIPSIVTPPPPSQHQQAPPSPPSSSSSNEQQIRLQIIASVFPPGSPNGSYITHLKTWEDVPGAPQGTSESKKPRYILLAVNPDGRCKIHKSKRNTNGTFSIGKTWNLEDLRALEVHKPRRSAGPHSFAVTCFTITINSKAYLWETESVRQQDDFLVTLVRVYRQYLNGATPHLLGFQVGEIPGAPPAYEVPRESGGMATPTLAAAASVPQSQQQTLQSPPPALGPGRPGTGSSRPGTAASVMSTGSSYYAGGSNSGHQAVPYPQQQHDGRLPASSSTGSASNMGLVQGGFAATVGGLGSDIAGPSPSASFASGLSLNTSVSAVPGPSSSRSRNATPTPTQQNAYAGGFPQALDSAREQQQQQQDRAPSPSHTSASALSQQRDMRKKASSSSLRDTAAAASPSNTSRPPLPIPASVVQQAHPSSRAGTPTRQLEQQQQQQAISSPSRRAQPTPSTSAAAQSPSVGYSLDETQAAANAAALLGQQGTRPLEDDSDVMLTNVEEMLEGLEWGVGDSAGSGDGGDARRNVQGADQIEKRLLGELNALEAAGIHAIIESDDRVNDVVKYLDNALAELDRMDLMLSLYRTHMNAASEDIAHIESQNKGLQIQSSNQRALLAVLDKVLAG